MSNEAIYYAIIALYNIISVLGGGAYIYFRKADYMRHRNFANSLVFMITNLYFGNMLITSLVPFNDFNKNISCSVKLASLYYLFAPNWIFTFVFSVGNLVFKASVNQRRLELMDSASNSKKMPITLFEKSVVWAVKATAKLFKTGNQSIRASVGINSNAEYKSASNLDISVHGKERPFESVRKVDADTFGRNAANSNLPIMDDHSNTQSTYNLSGLTGMGSLNGEIPTRVVYALHIVIFVTFAIILGVIFAVYGVDNCDLSQLKTIAVIAWILLFALTYLLRLAQLATDNYHIRRNIMIHTAFLYSNFGLTTYAWFGPWTWVNDNIGTSFFPLILNISGHVTIIILPVLHVLIYGTNSTVEAKDNITLKNAKCDELLEVFNNPQRMDLFKKVIAADFCSENILFYEAYEHAKTSRNSNALKKLYLDFIPPGSRYELNLLSSTVEELKAQYEKKKLSIISFEKAYQETMALMYANTFKRFKAEEELKNHHV